MQHRPVARDCVTSRTISSSPHCAPLRSRLVGRAWARESGAPPEALLRDVEHLLDAAAEGVLLDCAPVAVLPDGARLVGMGQVVIEEHTLRRRIEEMLDV